MNFTISNQNLTAVINPNGAELISLKKNNVEYIWEGNPEFWGKHSPILFPIVGTLKNDTFTYKDTQYQLSRHGFARDYRFEIAQSAEDSVVFSLKPNDATLKNYPFEFELRIGYTLQEDKLKISYEVLNENDFKMPFSIGGHPAFALQEKFENYALYFENDESLRTYYLENNLLSDTFQDISLDKNQLKLNYPLFENDALILKSLNSKSISILNGKKTVLTFEFEGFPNFGIWTKKDAPFICLEPWFGYSDHIDSSGDIFEKEGIQVLEPKETFQASFSIKI